MCSRRPRGFTLVELLVVIGIIALLISILLPALTAARRQAAAVKCAAQLREVGNAFQMYALESKGWFPVAQVQTVSGSFYNIDGVNYPTGGANAYWIHFLAKYVTKAKMGTAATTADDRASARNTVLWGCPAWEGYRTGAIGGINSVQNGFGMSVWPTFTPTYTPNQSTPPRTERAFLQNWSQANEQAGTVDGRFIKHKVWSRNGSARCLVADSIFWTVDAQAVPASGQLKGQAMLLNNTAAGNWAYGSANTLADAYRHGKYPPPSGDGFSHREKGGKVAFNMLYVDGHVGMLSDRTEAFRAIRQRFPG